MTAAVSWQLYQSPYHYMLTNVHAAPQIEMVKVFYSAICSVKSNLLSSIILVHNFIIFFCCFVEMQKVF